MRGKESGRRKGSREYGKHKEAQRNERKERERERGKRRSRNRGMKGKEVGGRKRSIMECKESTGE